MSHLRVTALTALGASLALAGCSNTTNLSYAERVAVANAFIASVGANTGDPITTLPASATYSGAAVFEHEDDVGPGETDFVGDVQVNVDFDAATLDGTVSNVRDENDNSYVGALDILVDNDVDSGTDFFGAGDDRTFIGAIDGTLTAGSNQLVLTDGTISGDFGGDTATDVAGFFGGTSTFNGEAGDVGGAWAATQSTVTP